jgi:sulfite reductase alpha subunit-like flavoprotein
MSQSTAAAHALPSSDKNRRPSQPALVLLDQVHRPSHRLAPAYSSPNLAASEKSSSRGSTTWSDNSSDAEEALTPTTEAGDDIIPPSEHLAEVDVTKGHDPKHAQTKLLTQEPDLVAENTKDGESGSALIQKYCCGGGCCIMSGLKAQSTFPSFIPMKLPDNEAYKALGLKMGGIHRDTELTNIVELPKVNISFESIPSAKRPSRPSVHRHPPDFVKPHPPYDVFSAPLHHARELTKPGAEKRTFHFDIDVTDYPAEGGDVDFKTGGAIGVCPSNRPEAVDELFDALGVPRFLRDQPVTMNTKGGRWPTIWGEEESRTLVTTRRELLTWCSDVQSYPPTKQFLRLLAEHATDPSEKRLLEFLCSGQGQPVFCDIRTGPHISIAQLLHAFPSAKPPLPDILSILNQLMPRFYSLSNDPHVSSDREGLAGRRLVEIAVTIHNTPDWRTGHRSGTGSGFLERIASTFVTAEQEHGLAYAQSLDLRIPMFRGLMANPLSREFGGSDGPMMLIGAGVGMAPFRGFILNRLRNANCASKIWLVQGVRDSSLDELYSGELGKYEAQIKKVVQSRASKKGSAVGHLKASDRAQSESHLALLKRTKQEDEPKGQWNPPPQNEARYVQDEVRAQGDIVWDVINAVNGRIFVCGSSKGMGEGVELALKEVVIKKKLEVHGETWDMEAAGRYWEDMKSGGKLVAETW